MRRVLGVTLKGGEGFTRWDKRPLTDRQIAYAADDARGLLALGAELQRRLIERGRLEWAREECLPVQESRDERSAEKAYNRLPKLARLDAKARAGAHRLCEWRDAIAREADRPPPSVLPDQVLVELAKRAPENRAGLENIRGLPQQTLHRRGDELLAEIAAGRAEVPPAAPPQPPRRDSREAPLVSLAQALVRQRSLDSGIATELIATQSEVAALVAALRRGERTNGQRENGVRALAGWRRELVGEELGELIAGRRAVSVEPGGGLKVVPSPEEAS
jgi:ribonuclease D